VIRKRMVFSAALMAVALMAGLLTGCDSSQLGAGDASPSGDQTPTQPGATRVVGDTPPSLSPWVADGVIGDSEYAHQTDVGEVRLWWRNDGQSLCLAMESPTSGWVSLGIDPVDRMEGANYVIGAVVGGEARVWDAYGTAPTGATHPPDEDLGGTNDIVAFAGVEEDGYTRFEVQIPLDSGDEFDKRLEPGGTYAVIAAAASSDSYDGYHVSRAQGTIELD
jgi:hypothetical protein